MKLSIQPKMNEKGISRYELAKRIGVTYPTITSIYNGESTSIKFEILESLCKELDCSPNDILIFDSQEPKEQQLKKVLTYCDRINNLNSKNDTN